MCLCVYQSKLEIKRERRWEREDSLLSSYLPPTPTHDELYDFSTVHVENLLFFIFSVQLLSVEPIEIPKESYITFSDFLNDKQQEENKSTTRLKYFPNNWVDFYYSLIRQKFF